jgi:hypothetical protein
MVARFDGLLFLDSFYGDARGNHASAFAAIILPRWNLRNIQWNWMLTPRATLWFWLIGPLVLLVPQIVKEPRHVAPCIVPAILLMMLAIDSISQRAVRFSALVLLCGVSVLQYFLSTTGNFDTPYFLDRALGQVWLISPISVTSRRPER